MMKKVVIIGSGISGLYLGYKLKSAGFSIQILEANTRVGGRIYTKEIHNTKIELGATWIWRYNLELMKLCKTLKISLLEEKMSGDALYEANKTNAPQRFKVPENQDKNYRIVGGTSKILDKLAALISPNEFALNQKVTAIEDRENGLKIITEKSEFTADYVVSTVPPQLLINSVTFAPKLDQNIIQTANNTHTWMKDSIKFAVVYETPFWKKNGLSGVGFSNVGPFTEIYDHCDFENKRFALMGFISGTLCKETRQYREEKVKEQLRVFFGEEGKNYRSFEEKVWNQEALLSFNDNRFLAPHTNNGHPEYQKEYLNSKFFIAGSETSPSFGGYMEGAIFRGNQIVTQLENKI